MQDFVQERPGSFVGLRLLWLCISCCISSCRVAFSSWRRGVIHISIVVCVLLNIIIISSSSSSTTTTTTTTTTSIMMMIIQLLSVFVIISSSSIVGPRRCGFEEMHVAKSLASRRRAVAKRRSAICTSLRVHLRSAGTGGFLGPASSRDPQRCTRVPTRRRPTTNRPKPPVASSDPWPPSLDAEAPCNVPDTPVATSPEATTATLSRPRAPSHLRGPRRTE